MSRSLLLTAGGLIVGTGTALALTRLLGTRLYQVSPHDPIAFASAFFVLTIVALLACLLPANRATHIDAARTLRA
jgi:ABC-type antimicrobial peptide transport system permease subunit